MARLVNRTIVWKVMILILTFNASSIFAQETDFSVSEYKGHLKFLSDDKLQGRAPGTLGGDIAAMYISSQFERCGLKPVSAEQGYFQQVPIKCVTTDYSSAKFTISGNGFEETIRPYDEILMISREDKELVSYTGELVFVGHGAIAPEYGWDDYKGIDVKGKIVVCLDNHPEFQSPGYKPGNTTYYGHWEYKPKIAFDKGAIGILVIVEDNAIFPWPLWQWFLSSASYGQNAFIASIPVISYISENAFDSVLKHSGLSVKALAEKAADKNFAPFRMQLNLRTSFSQSSKQFESPNVVGIVPGTKKPDEAVIIMAHYDHLGVGKSVNHDSIYNGTIDNASGTAALLNLASYFSEHPTNRSIIFLATTAEEMRFQGVEYYLVNPVIQNEKIICGLNMDMLNFLGRRDSIELSPVFYTDAKETIRKISRKMNLDLILSDFDNEFLNFRRDSWAFALYDVVTFNIANIPIKGSFPSITTNELENIIKAGGQNYHTPFDEIKPWFRYEGILQELELAKEVGIYYANEGVKPKFNKENPFAPAKLLWNKKPE
jgi:hypothetical protein